MKTIRLTKGYSAIVDDEDFEYLNQFDWQLGSQNNNDLLYAIRTDRSEGKKRTVRMHREILGAKKGEFVDHIDGNWIKQF